MHQQTDIWEIVRIILSILGSLALFLYGMKTMSEALQKIGSEQLRKSFSSIATNKFKGFLSGFLVTGTVQSSTAVSLTLISFLNAGFFTLDQSLAILIGSNVGTTLTAWYITLIGFHSKVQIVLLPVMAFTLPLLFRRNRKYRYIAEFIIGFVLIFTGFYFLEELMPSIASGSGFASKFSILSRNTFGTNILFALSGIILTILIRSSSASTALTIILCYNGWMSFENAAAMIIGENIGTTLTANIAAMVATNQARRLALAHSVFNIAGAIIFFIVFRHIISYTSQISEVITGFPAIESSYAIPIGLALFHSLFNIVNAILAFTFFKYFKLLLKILIPVKPNEDRKSGLKYIDTGYLSMSELALMQVHDEILNYGNQISEMFALIPQYMLEKQTDKFQKIRKKIYKFEERADAAEVTISNYLTRLAANDLTESASRKVSSMLRIIDDIESIADQCMQLERAIREKNEAKAWMPPPLRELTLSMYAMIREAIENMNKNLSKNYSPGILVKATELELKINNARDNFMKVNREYIDKGEYSYQHGAYFSNIANHCEKIGDHIINVNQAIATNLKTKN